MTGPTSPKPSTATTRLCSVLLSESPSATMKLVPLPTSTRTSLAATGSSTTHTSCLILEAMSTRQRFMVGSTERGFAEGNLFIARGEITDEYFQYFTITHSKNSIQVRFDDGTVTEGGGEINEVIDEVHIVSTDPTVLDADFACVVGKDQSIKQMKVETSSHPISGKSYLKISGDIHTIQFDEANNIFYGKAGRDFNFCDKSYTFKHITNTTNHRTFRLARTNEQVDASDLILHVTLLKSGVVHVIITYCDNSIFKVPESALHESYTKGLEDLNDEASLDDFVKYLDDTILSFLSFIKKCIILIFKILFTKFVALH